jgi:membrane-associated protease RseP (regulator of RpoE activity)
MTPLLHSVVVLAVGFVPLALAAPESAPAEVDVAWSGDMLRVSVSGPEPSVVAVAYIVRTLRGLPVDTPLAPWERVQADRALEQGQVPLSRVDEGPVNIVLTATAVANLRTVWGTTTRWHDRIPLAMSPQGPVVLETPGPDLPLLAGDVVQSIDGRAVANLDDIDRYTAFAPMNVLRNGALVALLGPPTIAPDDRLRNLAPTCGPCCHGHCGDDVEPNPFGGL